ncbi:regulatory protein RecX [Marinobacter salicampi]|uniref:regulatory protein RecX n=1 Tax=Marinobacter salicampi TaxID=435907 RepID=UPI00140C1D03|nr:regulatory protein RecX [Marinobacter salicampi]
MGLNKETTDNTVQTTRATALRLLARREHSRLELTIKLRQRKLPDPVIAAVLDEFEDEGWLSDERFADVYGRQRRDLGYGPLRIRSELQRRGVDHWPPSLAAMTDQDWAMLATRARAKKFGLEQLAEDWSEKARQARFLAQRGFGGEHAEQALEATSEEALVFSGHTRGWL